MPNERFCYRFGEGATAALGLVAAGGLEKSLCVRLNTDRLLSVMPVTTREQKIVSMNSGGACAFPGCGKSLISYEGDPDGTVLGEIAHIIAEHRQGPRGRATLTDEERNRAFNLVLLCGDHHTLIDDNPHTYSVQVLRQMKADHETRIATLTRPAPAPAAPALLVEKVHSTVLRVTQLPRRVFSAPCPYTERQKGEVARLLDYSRQPREELVPFILREQRLYAFHDLSLPHGPFAAVVDYANMLPIAVEDFASEAEGRRRLVSLLNISLSKFCGHKGVRYDPVHHRHIFEVSDPGHERVVGYRTLTGRNDSRRVVWNPIRKSTGEGKNHWLHLAAGLSFHQMAEDQWCLSIRPERHVTKDSVTPFDPKYVGRKVTRLKARMFNHAYLGEVHFWRDFLSEGKPRFILNFGVQSAIVETELVSLDVAWAGIVEDVKSFTNQRFEDDLFSFGDLMQATGDAEEDEEADDDDDDDDNN